MASPSRDGDKPSLFCLETVMAVLTQHHLFVKELDALLNAEIERLKDELSAGLLESYEDYQKVCGKIGGLRLSLDYMDEADSIVSKRLSS